MGFGPGEGVGVALIQPIGPVAIYAKGEVLKHDKVESPGWRVSGLATVIYGKRYQLEGGASWRQTKTDAFTKTGSSPLVGLGFVAGKVTIRGRYFLPDNTENKTDGFQMQGETRTRPYVLLRAGHFRFDQGGERLTDEVVSVGVGWSWH